MTQTLNRIELVPIEAAANQRTTKLSKSDSLELMRIVLEQGKEIPPHRAPGEITVQCIDGRVTFGMAGDTVELRPGQLLHVDGSQEHWLKANEPSTLLVTKVLS